MISNIFLYCCPFCVSSCFQNNVEIHVAHIQSGLSQLGNLHAFAANNTNAVWVPASSTPHAGARTHRVVGHFTFEMVLSPELLEGCKGKKKVPVNVVNHHLNEDVPVKRLGALPRLLRLCADAREDVKSVLPTCFSVWKCWRTQSNTNLKES